MAWRSGVFAGRTMKPAADKRSSRCSTRCCGDSHAVSEPAAPTMPAAIAAARIAWRDCPRIRIASMSDLPTVGLVASRRPESRNDAAEGAPGFTDNYTPKAGARVSQTKAGEDEMIRTVAQIKDELADREAIRDCLYRYCRGVDRCDMELLRSAYWPGAMDTHTGFKGTI